MSRFLGEIRQLGYVVHDIEAAMDYWSATLGRSIAKALGRSYLRMSLGGLHDEAEIRGHRKTYIGAMPGRVLQNIKKAKSSNPVFILDFFNPLSGFWYSISI